MLTKIYAVSDWKCTGERGLAVFLDLKAALDYYNQDDGRYRYRFKLLESMSFTGRDQISWMAING